MLNKSAAWSEYVRALLRLRFFRQVLGSIVLVGVFYTAAHLVMAQAIMPTKEIRFALDANYPNMQNLSKMWHHDVKQLVALVPLQTLGVHVKTQKAVNHANKFPTWQFPVSGVILHAFVNKKHPYVTLKVSPGSVVHAPVTGVVQTIDSSSLYGHKITIQTKAGVTVILSGINQIHVKSGAAIVQGQTLGFIPKVGPRTVARIRMTMQVQGKDLNPLSSRSLKHMVS